MRDGLGVVKRKHPRLRGRANNIWSTTPRKIRGYLHPGLKKGE